MFVRIDSRLEESVRLLSPKPVRKTTLMGLESVRLMIALVIACSVVEDWMVPYCSSTSKRS